MIVAETIKYPLQATVINMDGHSSFHLDTWQLDWGRQNQFYADKSTFKTRESIGELEKSSKNVILLQSAVIRSRQRIEFLSVSWQLRFPNRVNWERLLNAQTGLTARSRLRSLISIEQPRITILDKFGIHPRNVDFRSPQYSSSNRQRPTRHSWHRRNHFLAPLSCPCRLRFAMTSALT